MTSCKDDDKEELDYYISELEAETPFSAWGFYSVEKTTLTSLLSTVITYLIIMIQFQPGTPPEGE